MAPWSVLPLAQATGEDPDGERGVEIRLVPQDEIEANGWDLNIGRYLKTTAEDETSLDEALTTYLEAREARINSEKQLFERLTAAGIANLGTPDE